MQDLTTALLRTPSGLIARRLRDNKPTDVSRELPLAELPAAALDHQRELLEAVELLSNALPTEPTTLEAALTLVLATVPRNLEGDRSPARPAVEEMRPPRRTAAHPRAYDGTKYQPPKATATRREDLRPALASRKQTRQLLAPLWPDHLDRVHAAAIRLGVPAAGIRRLASAKMPKDPFLAAWFSGAPADAVLDSSFVDHLLWQCRGLPWPNVRELQGIYLRLRWQQQPKEVNLALKMLASSLTPRTVSWIRSAEIQPPDDHSSYLFAILESDVHRRLDPPNELLASLPDRHDYLFRMRMVDYVLEALVRGVAPGYLSAAFQLAGRFDLPIERLSTFEPCSDYDLESVQRLLERIPPDELRSLVLPLWSAISKIPWATSDLRRLDPDELTPPQLVVYLRFFLELRWLEDDKPMSPEGWPAVERHLPEVRQMLQRVPSEYTPQAANDLASILGHWPDQSLAAAHFGDAVTLVSRLQAPPIDPDGHLTQPLAEILATPDVAARQRLLEAPLASYVQLDRACHRGSAEWLLTSGLRALLRRDAAWVAKVFDIKPRQLCRAAKLLGSMKAPLQHEILESWRGGAACTHVWQDLEIQDLVNAADAATGPSRTPAIRKALRRHLNGDRALTPKQLERHRQRLLEAASSLEIADLERRVRQRLGRTVDAESVEPDLQFALQLLHLSRDNRPAFRGFLRAHLRGDHDFLRGHPLTRLWFRNHPKVDEARWLQGIEMAVKSPTGKPVVLAIEQDPMEVLKMGHYVGTCFALGGVFSHSAIGVLLDVNKQVIYARDARGSVIGRQQIAISETSQLVPYPVYPEAGGWLADAFRTYDRELAEHLGLEVSSPNQDEVANVLSEHIWDDSKWDDYQKDGS